MPQSSHFARHQRLLDGAVLALGLLLFALAAAYLVQKSIAVSVRAGYDFKFIWLAGEM